MEINQMLKRQEHFFKARRQRNTNFERKHYCAWNVRSNNMKKIWNNALYKDLGKSSFESYMAEIDMVKSELLMQRSI